MILRLQSAISLITCSCLISTASATSSSIGLVMSTGEVQVDGLKVPTTAAIFSGSSISSGDRSASLQFSDGTTALMKPGSTMTVYRERSVLQQGITMQRGVDKHPVLADGLRISSAAPNAAVLVGVKDASHIEVAGQEGESYVLAPSGDLIARVEPGKILSFAISEATDAQGDKVKLCGVLGQNFLITDHFTDVTYQLQGAGLASFLGKTVRITGTITGGTPTSPVAQTVAVSTIKRARDTCDVGAAALSTGALVVLISVAVGGTLLGIGLSGGFGTSQPPVTPATP